MNKFLIRLPLLILGISICGTLLAQDKEQSGQAESSLDRIVENLIAEEEQWDLGHNISSFLGLTKKRTVVADTVESEETSDLHNHGFYVVLESSSSKERVPYRLVFHAQRRYKKKTRSYYYVASLNGVLEKAILIGGRHDKNGKSIGGSGTVDYLKITKRKIKKRFQHELDFWLKGKYRRKQEE